MIFQMNNISLLRFRNNNMIAVKTLGFHASVVNVDIFTVFKRVVFLCRLRVFYV